MSNFENYISIVNLITPGLGDEIQPSINDFTNKYIESFNYNEKIFGLLHGQVQSGKTAQSLGIVAQSSDRGFQIFLYLTTDNVSLQQQTLERARNSLPFFQVFDENEDANIFKSKLSKPILIVLKKNKRVLSNWLTNLSKLSYVKQKTIMIIDDEGDAASLNTKVNKNEQSEINLLLEKIFGIPPSGIYLQVTATPQSLLLQSSSQGWKPSFAFSFNPGKNYKGGKDFFGENSSLQRIIEDDEVDTLLLSSIVPESLKKALFQFLVISIQIDVNKSSVCNMLIHPSHRTGDHKKIKLNIQNLISEIRIDFLSKSPSLRDQVYYAWSDLQRTHVDIISFEEVWEKFGQKMAKVRIMVLNSKEERINDYNHGINILIGGNVLGRGLTIPSLQVVYYTRQSKTPLADTVLQHQRIFGYDRILTLCRVFATKQLFKIFRDLTESSEVLFNLVSKESIEKISIMLPSGINPTRKNVLKLDDVDLIAGGVNYFPFEPSDINTEKIDAKLGLENSDKIISLDEAIKILEMQEVKDNTDWDKKAFIASVKATKEKIPQVKCFLIVRVDREITKGTRSLLSPNDRAIGDSHPDKVVLTMYRLVGSIEQKWNGKPLWVPNIKLPDGKIYWKNVN